MISRGWQQGAAQRMFLGGVCALLFFCIPSGHAAVDNLESLRAVPMLLNGRKVPLDTYARHTLLQFSGRSRLGEEEAVAWLARVFFSPGTTAGDALFLINHPEVAQALGVAVSERRRYRFADLEPGLSKLRDLAGQAVVIEPEQRTPVERELLRVSGNLDQYLALTQCFDFAAPHADFTLTDEVRARLQIPAAPAGTSFLDVFQRIERLHAVVEPLQGKEPESWTGEERAMFNLSAALYHGSHQHGHQPPEMIPLPAHGQEVWLSPWDALPFLFRDDAVREQILHLAAMAGAWRAGGQLEFDLAANGFSRSVRGRLEGDRELRFAGLEILYNRLQLFYRAETLYGLGFLAAFAATLRGKPWLRRLAAALIVLAVLPHTAGIVMRMLIMGRPPVTNLYATFVFVSWVGVVLCLIAEYIQRNGLGQLTAGILGLSLLMIAGRFATEGDQMGKVVAVLDSNFWLSTHVVCITLGYAGCVAAGVIGHIYVLHAILTPGNPERLTAVRRMIFSVLGFGLTFSFFGTMLGGVWADQSWGRFWGWDPKENGALLIVLWCAILFHARLGKMIGDLGLAVGAILGIIVVMFAWLGVNLLGVGLHSYGFTSGLARGLYIYVAAQLLFVLVAGPLAQARRRVNG